MTTASFAPLNCSERLYELVRVAFTRKLLNNLGGAGVQWISALCVSHTVRWYGQAVVRQGSATSAIQLFCFT